MGIVRSFFNKFGLFMSNENELVDDTYNENDLVFEVYDVNDTDFNKFVKKYGKNIVKMESKCFNKNVKELSIPNGYYVIAKLNDELVASLIIYFEGFRKQVPWIWNMCRNSELEYCGKGIGKKLMKYTLKYIQDTLIEYTHVHLYASQNPVSRTEYYKSLGFIETPNYDDDGDLEMIYNLYPQKK
jgi:predicted GNAT family N-acyltransferase